ncbi:hypothetical protein RYX36_016905 [Vicia faba]
MIPKRFSHPPLTRDNSSAIHLPPPKKLSLPRSPLRSEPSSLEQQAQSATVDEVRALWISDLQYWMDKNYLYQCFSHTSEVGSVKVIRNKQTNQSEGYGLLEFTSHSGDERVLQSFNGTIMPNGGQNFRLNWASFSSSEKRHNDSRDHTIFVEDLAADVTDYHLTEVFRTQYNSARGEFVIDRLTGRTKSCGFVRFADENEQMRAMTETQGGLK